MAEITLTLPCHPGNDGDLIANLNNPFPDTYKLNYGLISGQTYGRHSPGSYQNGSMGATCFASPVDTYTNPLVSAQATLRGAIDTPLSTAFASSQGYGCFLLAVNVPEFGGFTLAAAPFTAVIPDMPVGTSVYPDIQIAMGSLTDYAVIPGGSDVNYFVEILPNGDFHGIVSDPATGSIYYENTIPDPNGNAYTYIGVIAQSFYVGTVNTSNEYELTGGVKDITAVFSGSNPPPVPQYNNIGGSIGLQGRDKGAWHPINNLGLLNVHRLNS